MSDIAISSYLCARLCHDLVGPIGAAQNGLELIAGETNPADLDEAMSLITQSIGQAVGRIKFYRLAFGVATKSLTLPLARDLALQALPSQRVELDWPDFTMPQLSKPNSVRLALNIVLTAKELLKRGGLVRIDNDKNCLFCAVVFGADQERIQLTKDALNLRLFDEELSTELVPAVLAGYLAHQLGHKIHVKVDADQVSLRILAAEQ